MLVFLMHKFYQVLSSSVDGTKSVLINSKYVKVILAVNIVFMLH